MHRDNESVIEVSGRRSGALRQKGRASSQGALPCSSGQPTAVVQGQAKATHVVMVVLHVQMTSQ